VGHKEVPVTQLRNKVLEELQRRNYSQATVRAYLLAVRQFAAFFHRSPVLTKRNRRADTRCTTLRGLSVFSCPRRHFQSSASVRRRWQGQLPLEGLCPPRQATQDDGHRRRIPAPLPAPSPPARLRPHSLFRLPRQSAPETTSTPLQPVAAGRSPTTFGDARK